MKQTGLYNPNTDNQPKIYVYGLGSIGSHLVIGLKKTGLKNIVVYDFDKVENSNLPAQMYMKKHIGMKKTDAIINLVKEMTGKNDIHALDIKIINGDNIIPELNSIHILCFDNIKARKIVANKLNGFQVKIIDARIGGYNMEKYTVNCNDTKEMEWYLKTLEGEFKDLLCGEKCLWGINSQISSLIVSDILRLIKKKDYVMYIKRHLLSDIQIVKNRV